MTAVEKIDWFCPKCNSYVSSESVTFEETHQICNTGVILKELNQNKMTAVEYLINELSDIIGPIEATLSGELLLAGAIKRAKEMEKEQRERDFKAGNDSACMEHEDIKDYFDKYIKSE